MTITRDNVQVLGWAWESTEETDPITLSTSLYWQFGFDSQQFSLPIQNYQIQRYYDGSKRDPDLDVVQSHVTKSLGFFPTNLIPFYMALGSASSSSGVHTITGVNSGSLPTFTVRTELKGGNVSKYISAVGTKVYSLSFGYNAMTPQIPASIGLGYMAIKSQTAALNSAHGGIKYPTDDYTLTGTEQKNRFKADSNLSFIWDNGGDNVNYSNQLLNFNYILTNDIDPRQIQNQDEVEFQTEGNRSHIVNFQVTRGDDKSIFDDAGTKKDVKFKIYASATNYIQLTLTNCIGSVSESNYANFARGEVAYWDFKGEAESVSVEGKDGVSTSFYGL